MKFSIKTSILVTVIFLASIYSASPVCSQDLNKKTTNDLIRDNSHFLQQSATKNASLLNSIERHTKFDPQSNAQQNSSQNRYVRPDAKTRARRYAIRIVGPFALAGTAVSAGIAQINDNPPEWENNFKGYARRFASEFGTRAIRETVIYGIDESFRLDSAFYKSRRKNFKARFANAALSTFTARKSDGRRVFGFPRLIGTYTGSIVAAEAWFPKRFSYQDGLRDGHITLGVNVGLNFLREFLLPGR